MGRATGLGWGMAGAAALLALGGCATQQAGVQVTRFHLAQPIASGQITVEPMLPGDRQSLEFQSYASIVGQELARIGFTEAPGLTASEHVAAISVETTEREGPPRGGGLSIGLGLGGGSYGYRGGVGGGAGVSVPVSRPRATTLVVTRLVVQIKRRSDASVVWEGRAETAARLGTAQADPQTVVRRLAQAMFKDFPGQSGRTVLVK